MKIWKYIQNQIAADKKVVLLIVAESSVSSPGRRGFKMVVTEDAEIFGTIGGGIMEKDMVEYALDLLFGKAVKKIKRLHHSEKTKYEKSGLICGGYQVIVFSIIDNRQTALVNTIVSSGNIKQNGELILSHNSLSYTGTDKSHLPTFNFISDEDWEYKENIGLLPTAYIAGGGHVGLAVSRIMKSIGFYVIVFDHREDVFTIEQNEYADEIIITKYEYIGNKIIEGENSYIIIVTPMHAGDKETLKSVIYKNVKYVGMMGSQKKIKSIFNALRTDGVDEKLFEKVHTPIGIEISAESPEEIAISIAAEIISVKHGQVD